MGTNSQSFLRLVFESLVEELGSRYGKTHEPVIQPGAPSAAVRQDGNPDSTVQAAPTDAAKPPTSGLNAYADLFPSHREESTARPGVHTGELTTRGSYDSADIGGYFFSLEVDNLHSVLFIIGDCGHYDLTRVPLNVDIGVVDDEDEAVPIVLRRVIRRKGWTTVQIEVRPELPSGLPLLKPWHRIVFK
jgi:hypothetical protein